MWTIIIITNAIITWMGLYQEKNHWQTKAANRKRNHTLTNAPQTDRTVWMMLSLISYMLIHLRIIWLKNKRKSVIYVEVCGSKEPLFIEMKRCFCSLNLLVDFENEFRFFSCVCVCVFIWNLANRMYRDAGFKVELVKMVVGYSSRKCRFDIDKIRWEWDKIDIVYVTWDSEKNPLVFRLKSKSIKTETHTGAKQKNHM